MTFFFRIFRYYKEKDITIRVSSQFSYQELADFIEIDPDIIDFFRNELEAGLSLELAYDTVGIIAHCKRPYVHRSKIELLLFWIIDNPKYHHHIHAEAIRTFASLQFNESSIFAKIIASKIDLGLLEVRNACIFFLNTVDYYEDYSHFIIQSINVIESGQKASGMSGSFYYLKKLILAFKAPGKIKEIFQFAIEDRNCFERHSHAREFHFDYQEVTDLLLKAATAYKSDKTILPIIYRLFCQQEHITIDWEWFKLYKQFFEKTCGTDTVFYKFYRYAKKQRDIMAFADEACCSFLIKEYQAGKFDDKQMFVYRNTMSYLNRDLFMRFYDELKDLDNGKFIIEDVLVDYNDVRIKQLEKNQLMLLDQDLFLEEAVTIFGIISKENISTSDFWYSENIQLRKFQQSIVLETIRDMCIHDEEKSITKEEFLEKYRDIEEWNGFVVESTVELLKKKDVEVNSTLIELIKKWCSNKINQLDFENSIVDNGMSFRYTPLIEFVKDVYLLVQPELEDELLLKMLPSDYEGYYGWSDTNSKSVSAVITEKVNDKELLQNIVLNNIKSNKLATLVLCTHFTICDKLNYRQCLPFLYSTIVSNKLLTDHNRVHLTEYYINLGGQVADFVGCLKVPEIATEEARYASWHWFLIEKLQFIVPDRITEISLQILADPDQAVNKLHAAESLIQLSRIEGLEYVDTYVRETGIIPYDHKWSNFQQYIPDLPIEKAITIFCSLLEFSYENNLQKKHNGSHSIEVAFFGSLNTICSLDYSYFSLVKNHLAEMILKFSGSPIISSLKLQSERFIQRYFESQRQEIDIKEAILMYESITV